MSLFPADDKARKMLPIFKYIARYCPKALREVTKVSVANNVRYNPDRHPADINWARGKSNDQLGSAFRHMIEREVDGKIFEEVPPEIAAVVGYDRVYVLAEFAWRALAALELEIERVEAGEQKAEEPPAPIPMAGWACEPDQDGITNQYKAGVFICKHGFWAPETHGWSDADGSVHAVDKCYIGAQLAIRRAWVKRA